MGWGFGSPEELSSREKDAANALTDEQIKLEPLFHKPTTWPGGALFNGTMNEIRILLNDTTCWQEACLR